MEVTSTLVWNMNKFPKLKDAFLKGAGYTVHREAQETIKLAKEKYVPVVSGDLRNSSFVDEPTQTGSTRMTIGLGFGKAGSPAAKYALVVHERPPSIGQGKNKYLTKAVNERTGRGYEQRIGDVFRSWLARNL